MRLTKLLAPILLVGALAGGCRGTAYVVADEPPAPRVETVTYRPGYVWVHGNWARDGGRWAWRPGRFIAERHNQVYVEGRWERRGNRHVWVEGGWRARVSRR